jgi:hypothetical protein
MVLTAFALLLLSAEPDPSLAVVATATPGLERVAHSAGLTFAERMEMQYVELGSHLKTVGPGCSADVRCLLAAPALAEVLRVLHLRVSPLSGGRLSAELRLIDRARLAIAERSAAIVEPGELATWAEKAATRLFTRANAPARSLPPSPFPGRTARSAAVSPPAPPALPDSPPPPPVPPPAQVKGVRGADEEP